MTLGWIGTTKNIIWTRSQNVLSLTFSRVELVNINLIRIWLKNLFKTHKNLIKKSNITESHQWFSSQYIFINS